MERVGVRNWSLGSWAYEWNANGSLKSVKKPSGQTISFEYDALGRRTAKRSGNKEILYIWSGNVLLHEVLKTNDNEQVITWVYEQGSFVPTAKLIDNKSFSIVSDYIGRPIQVYDQNGEKVWSADYDIYGKLINLQGDKSFIPFRQLGQYEDIETGLYYNRFRYYDCNTGTYISQDPISILGGFNIYAYVHDVNGWVDIFGLSGLEWHHLIPQEMFKDPYFMKELNAITNGNAKNYINRQGVLIDKVLHNQIHKGPNGGVWNEEFKNWYSRNRGSLNISDLQSQLKSMMVKHNIPVSSRNFARKYNRKPRSKKTHLKRMRKKHH
ncbi:RHS repeat-associated core domain-containing protein [Capnocytophaga canimorsus]|uniref:RHS repeat-associated core domain-containing protein n=1 Tax=Capnocytophaga canimorsus TaxID=28188 RepID=UPI0037D76C75